ncbi:hypothetical protein [Nonomuraea sp. B5E05]
MTIIWMSWRCPTHHPPEPNGSTRSAAGPDESTSEYQYYEFLAID